MSPVSFDKHGFYFLLKVLVLVLVVVGFARIGAPIMFTGEQQTDAYNPQDSEHASLVQKAIDRLSQTADTASQRGAFARTVRAPAIADYVPEKGLFIGVDLTKGVVTIYEDGFATTEYPVVSYPQKNSPSFVPTGLYTVEELEREHLSNVTKVYYPDRIRFDDRFSIHGTPQPIDEVEVGELSLGSSIELSADDAARLFDVVTMGANVFVLSENAPEAYGSLAALAIESGALPAVSSRSFAIADAVTGEVYLEKNASERYPIASITKLMTALVANETYSINEEIHTSDGDSYVVGDLYYPLFLRSSNGVAHAIAAHGNTPTFLARMNTQARALGMYQTSFADSSGLSPKNISSAQDLAKLGQYLYDRKRFLLDISSADRMTITSSNGHAWAMKNQNKMARDPHFRGGKLGYTDEAGQTSLAVFTVPVEDEVRVIVVVVLNSRDWKQDTRTLLSWFGDHVAQK
jgi:hypothetical protein